MAQTGINAWGGLSLSQLTDEKVLASLRSDLTIERNARIAADNTESGARIEADGLLQDQIDLITGKVDVKAITDVSREFFGIELFPNPLYNPSQTTKGILAGLFGSSVESYFDSQTPPTSQQPEYIELPILPTKVNFEIKDLSTGSNEIITVKQADSILPLLFTIYTAMKALVDNKIVFDTDLYPIGNFKIPNLTDANGKKALIDKLDLYKTAATRGFYLGLKWTEWGGNLISGALPTNEDDRVFIPGGQSVTDAQDAADAARATADSALNKANQVADALGNLADIFTDNNQGGVVLGSVLGGVLGLIGGGFASIINGGGSYEDAVSEYEITKLINRFITTRFGSLHSVKGFTNGLVRKAVYFPSDTVIPTTKSSMDAKFQEFTHYYTEVVPNIQFSQNVWDYYGYEFCGYLRVPVEGTYKFGVNSDECSDLFLDGYPVASWYGSHGPKPTGEAGGTYGESIYLTAGFHRLYSRWLESAGAPEVAEILWQRPNLAWEIIPSSYLYYDANDLIEIESSVTQLNAHTTASSLTTGTTVLDQNGLSITSTGWGNGRTLLLSSFSNASPSAAFYIQRGGDYNSKNHLVIHSDSSLSDAGVNFMTGGGVSRMFIKSSNGNVGIANTDPSEKLHIDGNVLATQFKTTTVDSENVIMSASGVTLNGGEVILNSVGWESGRILFNSSLQDAGNLTGWYIQRGGSSETKNHLAIHAMSSVTGSGINLMTSGASSMLFCDSSTQKVGIGNTSPSEKLDVNGICKADSFKTITSSGSVGTLGSSGIELTGTDWSTGQCVFKSAYSGASSSANYFVGRGGDATHMNELVVNTPVAVTGSAFNVTTDGGQTSLLYVRSSDGRVGIGTANPDKKLDVNGTIKSTSLETGTITASTVTATSFVGDGSQLTNLNVTFPDPFNPLEITKTEVEDAGLVLHYSILEESGNNALLIDRSGSQNNGQISGTNSYQSFVTSSTANTMVIGRGFRTSGNDVSITLGSSINATDMTIAFWFYYEGYSVGAPHNTFIHGAGYHHLLMESTGNLGMWNGSSFVSADYTLQVNQTYHIVIRLTGALWLLSVNGVLRKTIPSISFRTVERFCNYTTGGNQTPMGVWSDFRVYSRYLSTREVRSLYSKHILPNIINVDANTGYVGIQQSNPTTQLDVVGDAKVDGSMKVTGSIGVGIDPVVNVHVAGSIGIEYDSAIHVSPQTAPLWPNGTSRLIHHGWEDGYDTTSYYTPGYHRSARVMSMKHGGQVRIDGYLGVNTAPDTSYRLHVNGDTRLEDTDMRGWCRAENFVQTWGLTKATIQCRTYSGTNLSYQYIDPDTVISSYMGDDAVNVLAVNVDTIQMGGDVSSYKFNGSRGWSYGPISTAANTIWHFRWWDELANSPSSPAMLAIRLTSDDSYSLYMNGSLISSSSAAQTKFFCVPMTQFASFEVICMNYSSGPQSFFMNYWRVY